MLKILNKRDGYFSRSKKSSKANSTKMQKEKIQNLRDSYEVDRNGYFVWKCEDNKTEK